MIEVHNLQSVLLATGLMPCLVSGVLCFRTCLCMCIGDTVFDIQCNGCTGMEPRECHALHDKMSTPPQRPAENVRWAWTKNSSPNIGIIAFLKLICGSQSTWSCSCWTTGNHKTREPMCPTIIEVDASILSWISPWHGAIGTHRPAGATGRPSSRGNPRWLWQMYVRFNHPKVAEICWNRVSTKLPPSMNHATVSNKVHTLYIDTVTFLVFSCLLGQIWHRSFAALSAKNWQGHIKHHQTSQSSRCAQDKQRSCWQQGSWRLCCATFPVCHGLQKCCAKSSLEGLKANCSKGRTDHLKRKQLSLGEGLATAGNYYPGKDCSI